MMRIKEDFGYSEDENIQVLSLGYKGAGMLKMVIILPKERYGLTDVEKSLNGSRLLEIVENLPIENVRVST